ncbi:MAG: zinc metallopeptidase [Bacteroidales bacterium]|nr:zinc metallopeptidase [Bacteroidales bacterium]MDD4394955.1 zinc metallopeptidase [Bacteroidales bacterium]
MYNLGYWVIFIVFMLLSLGVQRVLTSKFRKYSNEFLPSGLTGKDVAEKMLRENGIYDVQVVSTSGRLTDHYNPTTKTVNLSEEVYRGSSVTAAAVAAHECGHAVQHATAYHWLSLRSAMVPVVNIGSRISQWILIGGLILMSFSQSPIGHSILIIGIILFALTTLFAFITLPVEYNASNRALAWLEKSNLASDMEQSHAKDALRWAARTYVVAALASLATLLYYIALARD